VRSVALSYYYVLRSILRDHPELRGRCLTRCCHCGIFFLTHPRNAGRQDLRCPFGCREAERRQRSTERSVAYYRTPEGKIKKQLQNSKRRQSRDVSQQGEVVEGSSCPGSGGSPPPPDDGACEGICPRPESTLPPRSEPEPLPRFDRELVLYLVMVLGLIERRVMSPAEVEGLCRQVVRQHSIARRRRLDYAVWYLNNRPP
jgi:hypothetical protein